MAVPRRAIAGCRAAHAALLESIKNLSDEEVKAPSLLPGWSRGHVLSHLARNADSVVRHLAGAARGEVLEQYVGGIAARSAAIEEGATRPAAEIVDDVRRSAHAVERSFAELPPWAWENEVRGTFGGEYPAHGVVFRRWREVEAHHVDLAVGYGVERWPEPLVMRWLAEELDALVTRADPAQVLAWLIGRAPAPELGPW